MSSKSTTWLYVPVAYWSSILKIVIIIKGENINDFKVYLDN